MVLLQTQWKVTKPSPDDCNKDCGRPDWTIFGTVTCRGGCLRNYQCSRISIFNSEIASEVSTTKRVVMITLLRTMCDVFRCHWLWCAQQPPFLQPVQAQMQIHTTTLSGNENAWKSLCMEEKPRSPKHVCPATPKCGTSPRSTA